MGAGDKNPDNLSADERILEAEVNGTVVVLLGRHSRLSLERLGPVTTWFR